jgi:hypothetical protein
MGLQGYLAFNPVSSSINRRATLAYEVDARFGLSGSLGRTGSNNTYWDLGASYALSNLISADLRYYGAQSGDVGVVLNLSIATHQDSFSRLFTRASHH